MWFRVTPPFFRAASHPDIAQGPGPSDTPGECQDFLPSLHVKTRLFEQTGTSISEKDLGNYKAA